MHNQRRQLVVLAIGFSVALGGLLSRFIILDVRAHDAISLLTTFGREPKAVWGPSWQTTMEVLGNAAMALFYSGVVLMIAAVLAWLFLSHQVTDEKDAA
jgi:hypothetical protein